MIMLQRHMDQIDAASVGYDWLIDVGKAHGATALSCLTGKTPGSAYLAWSGVRLKAYSLVLRDDLNWSVLVCHDVARATEASVLRFMDEVDAVKEGEEWICSLAQKLGATQCQTLFCETPGGAISIWKDRQLLAYYLVARDDMNWTTLVLHDVSNTPITSF